MGGRGPRRRTSGRRRRAASRSELLLRVPGPAMGDSTLAARRGAPAGSPRFPSLDAWQRAEHRVEDEAGTVRDPLGLLPRAPYPVATALPSTGAVGSSSGRSSRSCSWLSAAVPGRSCAARATRRRRAGRRRTAVLSRPRPPRSRLRRRARTRPRRPLARPMRQLELPRPQARRPRARQRRRLRRRSRATLRSSQSRPPRTNGSTAPPKTRF